MRVKGTHSTPRKFQESVRREYFGDGKSAKSIAKLEDVGLSTVWFVIDCTTQEEKKNYGKNNCYHKP